MPELPEIETIRRQLNWVLPGKIFKSVNVRLAKQVPGISVKKFKKELVGSRIVGLDRRAKMLIIKTLKHENIKAKKKEKFLVFHLKMTGQLIWQNVGNKNFCSLRGGGHPIKGSLEKLPNKYSHVYFTFQDGSKLFFNDVRQFGWVKLIDRFQIADLSKGLGPEPLSKSFKLDKFIQCLKKRPKSRIYQALLDQRCVVGVGNIYANEALFVAGIKPTKKIKNVKIKEYKKLYLAIKKILTKAIAKRGTSIDKYLDALGNIGSFREYLKVYQRERKSCARKSCRGVVKRLKIGSRSVFYCGKCQK